MHVKNTVWSPPALTGSVIPSGNVLSGTKYGISYTPSATTAKIFSAGYYASVTWYQPKYASTYTDIARYGKNDYYGSYCMTGSGSTSHF